MFSAVGWLEARRAAVAGLLNDDDYQQIAGLLPPDDLRPFGLDDVPADLARAFTEIDGTRGRIDSHERQRGYRYLGSWHGP